MKTPKQLEKEFDKDFCITFCPVCGSDHLTGYGKNNPLLNGKNSWQMECNTCGWEFEIFILKENGKPKKFRFDDDECRKCNKPGGRYFNNK